MKRKMKCALGLLASVTAVVALSACSEQTVQPMNGGVIFTYTDANGNRTNYTATDLLGSYLDDSSSLSTEFDKVYEVLVRKYFAETAPKSELEECEREADQRIINDKESTKKNADANGTNYNEEWTNFLKGKDCENVKELWQLYLYEEEKEKFDESIYEDYLTGDKNVNGLEVIRDGRINDTTPIMVASDDYGIGNEGWLLEQMPIQYSHILVKFNSSSSKNFTEDTISAAGGDSQTGEAEKLGWLMMELAGANYTYTTLDTDRDAGISRHSSVTTVTGSRRSFGTLASIYTDDDASKTTLGETSLVTKKMGTDFVPEFKLGGYAFETLFNETYQAKENAWARENAYRLTPGLKKDIKSADVKAAVAAKTDDGSIVDSDFDGSGNLIANPTYVDDTFTLSDGSTVYEYIKKNGLGTIPFGAAVAMLDYADVTSDTNGQKVNEGNSAYYPRNIIFNKYFNKHQICVITPNAIPSNLNMSDPTIADAAQNLLNLEISGRTNSLDAASSIQDYDGAYCSSFAALPGFGVDTTGIINVKDVSSPDGSTSANVLTNSEGKVILATRVSSGGYEGLHFIVVDRNSLSQYGSTFDASTGTITENFASDIDDTNSKGIAKINDYYTVYNPNLSGKYPTYGTEGKKLNTYVNFIDKKGGTPTSTEYGTRVDTITSGIKGYNDNGDTYIFEKLVKGNATAGTPSITFADKNVETDIETYVRTKRQSSVDSNYETWSNNWRSYAELIKAQIEARDEDGEQTKLGYGRLIPESVAIEYAIPADSSLGTKSTDRWLIEKGGYCAYEE